MFKKIVIVEPIFMEKEHIEDLKDYCDELIVYNENVNSEEETINRINDADCV